MYTNTAAWIKELQRIKGIFDSRSYRQLDNLAISDLGVNSTEELLDSWGVLMGYTNVCHLITTMLLPIFLLAIRS